LDRGGRRRRGHSAIHSSHARVPVTRIAVCTGRCMHALPGSCTYHALAGGGRVACTQAGQGRASVGARSRAMPHGAPVAAHAQLPRRDRGEIEARSARDSTLAGGGASAICNHSRLAEQRATSLGRRQSAPLLPLSPFLLSAGGGACAEMRSDQEGASSVAPRPTCASVWLGAHRLLEHAHHRSTRLWLWCVMVSYGGHDDGGLVGELMRAG